MPDPGLKSLELYVYLRLYFQNQYLFFFFVIEQSALVVISEVIGSYWLALTSQISHVVSEVCLPSFTLHLMHVQHSFTVAFFDTRPLALGGGPNLQVAGCRLQVEN